MIPFGMRSGRVSHVCVTTIRHQICPGAAIPAHRQFTLR
ncbi:uncharacterized protein CLUP02_09501 [Colletotrichum lupini]|uniref:Uncharacterized protein n=2 Tax=Colletotrichum acutatum species complex TaxID=2707335 RepID=A0A9P9X4T5_9PEZI|nr:uncharacterized protein CLUP02_09501 [Colletotrichum lupini]KAI3536763.1 hypothetical protein CABS02_12399 [Colletotrichum abscissum]UQC84005.1 hypothetical protein CLUP02_09501 [Colletotrichum lupini]